MANIKICTESELPFNAQEVANSVIEILNQTGSVSIELEMVDELTIKTVNQKHRNVDAVTDVLSFPSLDNIRYEDVTVEKFPLDLSDDGESVFLGSILICKQRAIEQAKEYNHTINRELCYLFCHGLLHLFGYDHVIEVDDIEMRELADEALNKINVTR